MPRYAFHMAMACVFGLCTMESDVAPGSGDNPRCICKPVMKLEWEPTASICNNATFDWLLHTTLSQVTKQNEEIVDKAYEIDSLRQDLEDKEGYIAQLERKVNSLSSSIDEIKTSNTALEDQLEGVRVHRAHLNPYPKDCADVQRYGFHYSGIYSIYPSTYPDGLEVFCDLNTDGGGWLVFQRRQDGSQGFDKLWDDYKSGFGTLAKEFWLGNNKLHELTEQRQYELRIDLTDFLGNQYYATYDTFHVDDEYDKYSLHLGEYEGNAGDALRHHNNSPFSTTDNDNDKSRSGNCAELYGSGGWWFVSCYDSNLNGIYSNRHLFETIVWYQLRQNHEPMRHTEMKMRPKAFHNN